MNFGISFNIVQGEDFTVTASSCLVHTVPAQIERRRLNNQRGFLGALVFKFEQSAVVIKMP